MTQQQSEEWKAIPGYEGKYEVSSRGQVRSLSRLDARGRRRAEKMLSPRVAKSGHLFVALYGLDGRNDFAVHVIVLEAFVGPRPDGMDACHWNDVPCDNRVDNLRWGTRANNAQDCVRNGNHVMANRTHCPQGHPYTLENTYHYPAGNRACNECRRIYRETHRDERRAKGREYMRAKRAMDYEARNPTRKAA